jgi:hypothetical protein
VILCARAINQVNGTRMSGLELEDQLEDKELRGFGQMQVNEVDSISRAEWIAEAL